MHEPPTPLRHHNYDGEDDEGAARLATQHLARFPQLQLVAELLDELRRFAPAWWTPEKLHDWFPPGIRMGWLRPRPDIRQRITTQLTGLSPRAARKKNPCFQAELIDAVIAEGDITVPDFESAFEAIETATYGPCDQIWARFRQQLPLHEDRPDLRGFVAWLLKALMADKSAAGNTRRPILDALDVRSSIAGDVWHTHMPLDIRVAIDHARFRQERDRKGRPFHAQHDLQIATIDRIAMHLPLLDLDPVLDRATEAMGFDHENVDQVVSTDVEGPLFEAGDATPSARRSPPPPSRAPSKRISRASAPATTRTPTSDADETDERLSGERLSTRVA